jgi:hypothetical protein
MAPEVVKILLGRVPPHVSARLQGGFARHPVRSRVYPGVVAVDSKSEVATAPVSGLLYTQLSPSEMKRLDWFEGSEYQRMDVAVETGESVVIDSKLSNPAASVVAHMYVWSDPIEDLDVSQDWSYDDFRTRHLSRYLQTSVRPCLDELERLQF